MKDPFLIMLTGAGTIATLVATGYFTMKRMILRSKKAEEKKLKDEQREVIRYALESYHPFHWEALHFAILSQEFRQKTYSSSGEDAPEKVELLSAGICLKIGATRSPWIGSKISSNE